MKAIKNSLTAIFSLFILVMFAGFVSSECSTLIDTPDELRKELRDIVLTFLSDPASSPYILDNIIDLLDFYKNEKDSPLIIDCSRAGSRSGAEVSSLLGMTINCGDGICGSDEAYSSCPHDCAECTDSGDNDGDGLADLLDAGCTDPADNDETNCGDSVCEGGETCSSCAGDCGLCPYTLSFAENGGNPGGFNVQVDSTSGSVNGWKEISFSDTFSHSWSSIQAMPFQFEFFGVPVGRLWVTKNGLISFDFGSPQAPNANTNLPSTSLSGMTIACFWDSTTDSIQFNLYTNVLTKTFGNAPNRQFWIKWESHNYGNPPIGWAYFSCVLEESTNNVYMVDYNYHSAGSVSSTAGLQYDTGLAAQFNGNTIDFGSGDSRTSDNDYYKFAPSCGNGQIGLGEDCENGGFSGETCQSQGFDGGDLSCVRCKFDLSACYKCGDSTCDATETCSTCEADCGACICGDGACVSGETPFSCPGDCVTECNDNADNDGDGSIDMADTGCIDSSDNDETSCADGVISGTEACDGPDLRGETCQSQGFDGGTLACGTSCSLDTSQCYKCGDGDIDPGEECDGANLGGQTCEDRGFTGGTLSCGSQCQFDTSRCKSFTCGDSIEDSSRKKYGTVQIGAQCWMKENINVGTFTRYSTSPARIDKYCLNNAASSCNIYGGLYTWAEMMQSDLAEGSQGICPQLWHIPTSAEWATLAAYLGPNAGDKLKKSGLCGGRTSCGTSGFDSLLGGWRSESGNYWEADTGGHYWTSTSYSSAGAWYKLLRLSSSSLGTGGDDMSRARSVRCIKD